MVLLELRLVVLVQVHGLLLFVLLFVLCSEQQLGRCPLAAPLRCVLCCSETRAVVAELLIEKGGYK